MAEATGWASFAQSGQGRGGAVNRFKLAPGDDNNIRFVGDPLKFDQYFINGKSAITDGGDECIIRRKYSLEPGQRFVAHIIDRKDGQLKIFEFAPSIAKKVIAWWKARKKDPGRENGCDFNIGVTGQAKNTRYEVTALDITPFTEAELAMIQKEVSGGVDKCLDRLSRLYKPTPQAEIEAKLGLGGSSQPSGNSPQQQAVPQTANAGNGKPAGWSEPPF